MLDEESLPTLDRDADLAWLAECFQHYGRPLEPRSIVRHPKRQAGRAGAVEHMDLVMLLPNRARRRSPRWSPPTPPPRHAAWQSPPWTLIAGARGTSPSGRYRLASRAEARVCRRI
jgi:hypothetical protein